MFPRGTGPRWLAALLCMLLVLPAMGAAVPAAAADGGVAEVREAWFIQSDAPDLPDDAAAWQAQPLPDSWRLSRPGQAGYGWYRASFTLPAPPDGMHAVYISLVSSAYALYINGVQVADSGGMSGNVGRSAGFPQWITVPAQVLAAGPNTLALRLRVAPNLRGGLSPLFVGPQQQIERLYWHDAFWRVEMPRALNAAVLVLGLLALLLWSRNRSEAVYGWFGAFLVTSAVWALRNFHQSLTLPEVPSRAWETFVLAGQGVSRLMLMMFVLRYVGQRRAGLERAAVWAIPLIPLLFFAAGEAFMSSVRNAWYTATALPMWYSLYLLARHANWRGAWGPRLVLGALACNEVLAVHDWMIAVNLLPFGTPLWQNYGVALLLTAMTAALAESYFAAFATARTLNRELEQRVAQKSRELDENFRKVAAYEQALALDAERQRLMRDMHDGIGSQLITTVNAVERGQIGAPAIAALLRDCIEDLRLVIDSLEPANSDLAIALASLRYRLEPRLRAAGLETAWELDGLPASLPLPPRQILQTLRILQEGLTNIIKHAGACTARLTAAVDGAWIDIQLADDGRGGPAAAGGEASTGRGLANMRYRATQMGGHCDIRLTPSGTLVALRLPRPQAG